MPRLSRFTFWTIIFNLAVILWGAWVRSSGSGAGCGAHWPLCNAVVIPQSPTAHTVIEFTHRLTSGVAYLLVILMVIISRQQFPASHAARRWAWASLGFMSLEAALGAGLVLFRLVANDDSVARAISLGAHLLNTMLLLAALFITHWSARDRPLPSPGALARTRPWFLIGLAALMLTGMAGAVVSLGDTLYPSGTLSEGLAQDFSPTSHWLIRLRFLHPLIAIVTGIVWLLIARAATQRDEGNQFLAKVANILIVMVSMQWVIGFSNIIFSVPTALQLMHLLAADLLWLSALQLVLTAMLPQVGRTRPASNLAASMSNTFPAPVSR